MPRTCVCEDRGHSALLRSLARHARTHSVRTQARIRTCRDACRLSFDWKMLKHWWKMSLDPASGKRVSFGAQDSRRRCGRGEPISGAYVAGPSPVPAQMWQGRARSRCRCGTAPSLLDRLRCTATAGIPVDMCGPMRILMGRRSLMGCVVVARARRPRLSWKAFKPNTTQKEKCESPARQGGYSGAGYSQSGTLRTHTVVL